MTRDEIWAALQELAERSAETKRRLTVVMEAAANAGIPEEEFMRLVEASMSDLIPDGALRKMIAAANTCVQ